MTKRNNPQLRIIGGQWRGRKLSFAETPGLRPTGDRIRETLFNWLIADIPNSCCLDLFAGSGILGFECLSRGAKRVVMLEQNYHAWQQLQTNAKTLKLSLDTIIKADSLNWLDKPKLAASSIHIAFIDPPFASKLWAVTCNKLAASNLLANGAKIYIETPKGQPLTIPQHWHLHREKHTGDISFRLFEYSH